MALHPGERLGVYEVVGPIGAGGMGAVYRARDTKLHREVALKVLQDAVVDDPERRSRFEREAQLLATLNHPNIAQVYGLVEGAAASGGAPVSALVMELVEGPTLAELVRPAGLPVSVALPLARQIVDALEAAHEQGIVHRDLKPANIKVRPDDTVKVLDFGLAKAFDPAGPSGSSPSLSTTMGSPAMTAQGVILGTAAYMSPEQARGKSVDKRADIWAFGCVLYEMLTGQTLFGGETVSDVLAAILARDPDWSRLPSAVPANVRMLLARCLERDSRRRLRDIGDARLLLDEATPGPTSAVAVATPARARPRLALGPVVLASVAAALVASGITWWATRPTPAPTWTAVRLDGPATSYNPRLSPDGQLLAFLTLVDRQTQLAVMKPNADSWTVLTSDRTHGYVTSVSWAPDGSRLYFDRFWGRPAGIYWVPPLGGEPREVLPDAFSPEALADGTLLVGKLTERGDEQVVRYWPDSGKLDPLPAYYDHTDVGAMVRALPDGSGFVLYGMTEAGRSGTPALLEFNFASRTARALWPGFIEHGTEWAPLAVSPNGQFVYVPEAVGDLIYLVEVPRSGGRRRRLLNFANSAAPVSMHVARDGSVYVDQLIAPNPLVRVAPTGGGAEEFNSNGTNGLCTAAPGGQALFTLATTGKAQVMVQQPGHEPEPLVDASEPTHMPATILPHAAALAVGPPGDLRLALASREDRHIIRRYTGRVDPASGLSAPADGRTLYYAYGGGIWSQPVDGGAPTRVTDGIDVVADPSGAVLYIKRAHDGRESLVRFHLAGGSVDPLPLPDAYHVGLPPLSSAGVDSRGRLVVSVLAADSFFYQAGILDTATKAFTLVPLALDGDFGSAGWTPDGRLLACGRRYLLSLWHYLPGSTN